MGNKIIIVMLLITLMLAGKTNAATLTQKIGNESMQTTVEENQIVKMKFTSKEGLRFKRWVIEEGVIEGIDITSNEIRFRMTNTSVVIKGEYDTSYVVTFNGNNGSGTMADITITAGGSKNLTKNTFVRAGYKFKGWSEEINGEVKYADEASCTPEEDLTLYAVWEGNAYTIIYDGNDSTSGSMENSSHICGTEKELATNSYTKDGCTFEGWSETANGEVKYTDREKVINLTEIDNDTVTLYAVWKKSTIEIGDFVKFDLPAAEVTIKGQTISNEVVDAWTVSFVDDTTLALFPYYFTGVMTLSGMDDYNNYETYFSEYLRLFDNLPSYMSVSELGEDDLVDLVCNGYGHSLMPLHFRTKRINVTGIQYYTYTVITETTDDGGIRSLYEASDFYYNGEDYSFSWVPCVLLTWEGDYKIVSGTGSKSSPAILTYIGN